MSNTVSPPAEPGRYLCYSGATVVGAADWSHMALAVSETSATIYRNGQVEDARNLAAPLMNLIVGGASLGA